MALDRTRLHAALSGLAHIVNDADDLADDDRDHLLVTMGIVIEHLEDS